MTYNNKLVMMYTSNMLPECLYHLSKTQIILCINYFLIYFLDGLFYVLLILKMKELNIVYVILKSR